ncbi:MAG: glycosyltransferase [Phycisphaerae bacterium]|nr:glycosyltransferase [Phycisphaerae bacterium]
MHAVLFAYYFPPDGGAGTQRPTSFARYLPTHDVSVTVVTRTPPNARNYYEPADAGLLAKVSGTGAARCRIARTPTPSTGIAAWLPEALALGERVIAEEKPDVILVTMSPFELWRVGATLADRHKIPVVFDLRDPWALDGVQSHRTYFAWRKERDEMRAMLQRGDGVIANTPECRTLFRALEPSLAPERIETITNGWDRDDFPAPAPRVPVGDAMRIVFTGSFLCKSLYETQSLKKRLARLLRYTPEPITPSGRTPLHLLRAMRLLRDRGEAAGRETRFVSVGQADEWLERCVRESGVAEQVELRGYCPHDETVRAAREADALFLTLHGLPRGHRSRIVPGKAYEYLATGRPILGALPTGDAREIVEASGRGFCADPCNDEDMARAIKAMHEAWRRGAFVESAQGPNVAAYERSKLAGDLARFLARVVAAPAR